MQTLMCLQYKCPEIIQFLNVEYVVVAYIV